MTVSLRVHVKTLAGGDVWQVRSTNDNFSTIAALGSEMKPGALNSVEKYKFSFESTLVNKFVC